MGPDEKFTDGPRLTNKGGRAGKDRKAGQMPDEEIETYDWLCTCGRYNEDWPFHCQCGREPPCGCDCEECNSENIEEANEEEL